ncbi:MAG TPA: hypothetical protein VLN56_01150 [Gammaproteobacteria bacterium]|nr:hypothetical protein [Gammaproteobacteria bacterium]
MHISFIKKIKQDGSPCRKCGEVEGRLQDAGLMGRIDRVIIADERDPQSEGMQLAEKHQVERAPFFIVEEKGKPVRIYTVYFKFLKEVLNRESSEADAAKDIMDSNPDIDYI